MSKKPADEILAIDSSKIEEILNALDIGICVIDPDFTISWANQKMLSIFSAPKPIGQTCYRLFERLPTPCTPCPVSQSFRSGNIHKTERYNQSLKKWFFVLAQPIKTPSGSVVQVVETVTDVTEQKQMTEKLKEKTENLEDLNTTLGVLLEQRATDKANIERTIVTNIHEKILPHVNSLWQRNLTRDQKKAIELIDTNLKEVTSMFSPLMSDRHPELTLAEWKITILIRQGMRSKEIASFLGISAKTVKNHRVRIRAKLGLANSRISLRSYLLSVEKNT